MRHSAIWAFLFCVLAAVGCQKSGDTAGTSIPGTLTDQKVEAACGNCIYGMEGVEGCPTAVKIDGQPYLVAGEGADAHGLGLCGSAKEVVVSGKLEDDKFVATRFELAESATP